MKETTHNIYVLQKYYNNFCDISYYVLDIIFLLLFKKKKIDGIVCILDKKGLCFIK